MMPTTSRSTLAARRFVPLPMLAALLSMTPAGQEWLTPDEIFKLQERQELVKRIDFYMDAAELRLKQAEERLEGKSTEEGDPFEFHSVVDLVKGCQMALRASMINIQDQFSQRKAEKGEIIKALNRLKKAAESFVPRLKVVLDKALSTRDEPLARTTHECNQYAESAIRGADEAVEKLKKEPSESRSRSIRSPSA